MKYSTQIYQIYLRYFAPEDIHVYSIDEVFIDLTGYLTNYRMGAKELISKVIQDVLKETGITATAGIGTNLYLAKIAMDIMAKHVPADKYGVRIAYLDEITSKEIMGTSADYRFLESRERLCQKACCISDLHDGRRCQMLCWKRKGIS